MEYLFKKLIDFLDGRQNSSLVLALIVLAVIAYYISVSGEKEKTDDADKTNE